MHGYCQNRLIQPDDTAFGQKIEYNQLQKALAANIIN